MYSCCDNCIVAPICTTNQRWPISEPESCEQALPLPSYEAASRNKSTMNLQQTDLSTRRVSIVSIRLANWEKQCLKVHRALSSLLIHTRFDDIMQSRGWNKFRGLCVDCIYKSKKLLVIMKGTEVPNLRRSSACDCTCVLTRIDYCLVVLSCLPCAFCFVPAYAKFAHKFLILFHRPCATYL